MFVHHEGLVVAYTWNREKQMFVALGKEFDMRMLHDYVGENVCFNKKISGSLCLFLTVLKSLQVIPTNNLFPVDF